VQSKRRLGLLGMQERVRLVEGKFAIVARPAVGTKVRVIVPLTAGGPNGRTANRFPAVRKGRAAIDQQTGQSRK